MSRLARRNRRVYCWRGRRRRLSTSLLRSSGNGAFQNHTRAKWVSSPVTFCRGSADTRPGYLRKRRNYQAQGEEDQVIPQGPIESSMDTVQHGERHGWRTLKAQRQGKHRSARNIVYIHLVYIYLLSSTLLTASTTCGCDAAGAATTPLFFANVRPTLKSNRFPCTSLTIPPASRTIRSPAA